jgi:glycosyltransferase involved in cell wall biosynthesis
VAILEAVAARFSLLATRVPYAEMPASYGLAKIGLNRSAVGDVNRRLFEITACGLPLVTDLVENGLSTLFDLGSEIITYRSTQECIEAIGALLRDDERRATIARAGRDRVLAEHTYEHRAESIIQTLTNAPRKRVSPRREGLVRIRARFLQTRFAPGVRAYNRTPRPRTQRQNHL